VPSSIDTSIGNDFARLEIGEYLGSKFGRQVPNDVEVAALRREDLMKVPSIRGTELLRKPRQKCQAAPLVKHFE
jgi:hypothetical protein